MAMKITDSARLSLALSMVFGLAMIVPAYGQYCGVEGVGGSYLNARYGFEIQYAGGWHRLHVGPRENSFQWTCRDTLVVDATVLDLEHVEFSGEKTHADSLWKAVTHKATLFCGADGVEGGSHCEGPVDVGSFTSRDGVPVLKFYQTFIYEHYADVKPTEGHRVGPYYAVDISQQGMTRALLLTSEMHREASDRYAAFVEGMVQSVQVVDSAYLKKKRRPIVVPLRR
jgi:hypothetical protein